jgi:transcriptional regulator with XRE-family HTH domain
LEDDWVFDDPFLAVVRGRIKAARVAKKIRQEDAAELSGIELRNWQRLEGFNPRRKFNPTLETLRAVAQVLEITVGDLTKEPTPDELETLERNEQPGRVMRSRT